MNIKNLALGLKRAHPELMENRTDGAIAAKIVRLRAASRGILGREAVSVTEPVSGIEKEFGDILVDTAAKPGVSRASNYDTASFPDPRYYRR